MGQLRMTIGAVDVQDQYLRDGSLSIDKAVQTRTVLKCTLLARIFGQEPNAYRPELREPVTVVDDGVPIFGGIVWEIEERGIAIEDGVSILLTAVDYTALLDVVLFNGILAAGTLRSQVTTLIANVVPHGITMDDGGAAGPAMLAVPVEFRTIREALDTLALQSGWMWQVNLDSTVSIFQPGTVAAPFPIEEFDGLYRDLTIRKSLANYSNEVWARGGPTGLIEVTETFTGDGSASEFMLLYQWAQNPTMGTLNVVIGGTPAIQTVDDETNTGPPAQWTVEVRSVFDNTIVSNGGALGSGDTVSITYFAQAPINIFDRDQGEYDAFGPFTAVQNYPDVLTRIPLIANAAGFLRQHSGVVRHASVVVFRPGLEPLQTLSIRSDKRAVQADFLIESVRLVTVVVESNTGGESLPEYLWGYQVDAIEGNEYQGNWESFFFTRAGAWNR